jgi:methionyl aminopeptidase
MNLSKNVLDINKMREASQLAAHVLEEVDKIIKPGISTLDIDNLCYRIITEHNAIPGALNYHGFPKSVCTSINDVICHGIPSEKDVLKKGDIINVDVALKLNNHFGDTSRCFQVGKVEDKHKKLLSITYEAMWAAIAICKNGIKVNEIGRVIQEYIKPYGYGIVKDFCGHGIGHNMHEEPEIAFFYDANNFHILETGRCYTMINIGSHKVRILPDKWTAKTIDGTFSAQWEHTIYINDKGCEVMSFNSFDKSKGKSPIINI